ncbi:MAG TPA: glycosyltransferase family 1 protein [Roseiarcus sp.]|jgi:glycosyltransferase involved in cell wall biosynthesis
MSARILYDGHHLTMAAATGIGTYTRTLAATAKGLGFETEVLVGGNAAVDKRDPQLTEVTFFDALTAARTPFSVRKERMLGKAFGKPFGVRPAAFSRVGAVFDTTQWSLSGFEKTYVAPIVFELGAYHFKRYGSRAQIRLPRPPALFHLSYPAPLSVKNCPNVYTIHDIVPLRLPQATLDDKKFFLRLIRHLCAKADHIVTVSEFSRRDIIRFTGIDEDRITNTYQSVHLPEAILSKSDEAVAEEIGHAFNIGLREYYVFYGAIEPKKNVARLIDAYSASGSPYPLLIVGGPGWQCDREMQMIGDERFLSYRREAGRIVPERRVRRIPYLRFTQLMTLIKGARGVLFPSLYEGFGLPVLEAMLLGVPVITSDVASLPEISGDAAALVDPTDVEAIAGAIRAFDHDGDWRSHLSAKGRERAVLFSPSAYQIRIGALYSKLGVEAQRVDASA